MKVVSQQTDAPNLSEELPSISKVTGQDKIPLSFMQEWFWWEDQMVEEPHNHLTEREYRIQGQLNIPALRESLNKLIERHEPLRTRFVSDDDGVWQVVDSVQKIEFSEVDLCSLNSEEKQRAILQHKAELRKSPAALDKGPLFRASVYKLEAEEYILVLYYHHIIFDVSSLFVLHRDLSQFYQRETSSTPENLPLLPFQYSDYANWQRMHLKGNVLNRKIGYWKNTLAGAPEFLNLPTDFQRPKNLGRKKGQVELSIEADLTQKLAVFSRSQGATLNMTLFAAWFVLFSRLSGQDDIVMGALVSERNQIELKNILGLFVNTVPVRLKLSGNPTFVDTLQRYLDVYSDAIKNNDIPTFTLARALKPNISTDKFPIYQVLFNFIMNKNNFQLSTLSAVPLNSIRATKSSFEDNNNRDLDIAMMLFEDKTIISKLSFNMALFKEERMTSIMNQYSSLLRQIADNPNQPLMSYELTEAIEKEG